MVGGSVRLGVDFGTSNTVAVLALPTGVVPLLFDGSPLLPSDVCADPLAGLLVGRDARHAGRTNPSGYEPSPKRCVDDGVVLLGGTEVAVPDLIGAVLRRVRAEARRVADAPIGGVVLTHPAGWGGQRRQVLSAAARAAGFSEVRLVAEPVAAATHFLLGAGNRIPAGASALVYDFGAGTFDATVVRRTDSGFEVLASTGLTDAGGLDIDMAILTHLGATYAARDSQRWARLVDPASDPDRRARLLLWDDIRAGKEMLSRTAATLVHVPHFEDDAPLGREQLERLARPTLERTVTATRAVLVEAGVGADALAGVFLVGGSSRIPLAGTLLHQALGVAPIAIDQPELAVALGSLLIGQDGEIVGVGPPAAPPRAPRTGAVSPEPPAVPPRPRRPTRREAVVAFGAVAVAAVAGVAVVNPWGPGRDPSRGTSTTPTTGHSGAVAAGAGSGVPRHRGPLVGHQDIVLCLAFSPDGGILATGGSDDTVRLWDTATGTGTRLLTGHRDAVLSVRFSPDGRTLATAGHADDRTVRLWDVATGEQTARFEHPRSIQAVAFSPDGTTLATGSLDRIVRLWDLAAGTPRATVAGHSDGVLALAYNPDGTVLASGGHDFRVLLRSAATGQVQRTLTGHTDSVQALRFSPDGATLASGSIDESVRLWDVGTGSLVRRFTGTESGLETVAFSPDGRYLLGASEGDETPIWEVATARLAYTLSNRGEEVMCADYSPDGRTIATGGSTLVRLQDTPAEPAATPSR